MKIKSNYVCQKCGAESAKWQGQCADCGAWNSLLETRKTSEKVDRLSGYAGEIASKVQRLDQIDLKEVPRLSTGMQEFDRVLGGGLVPGSVVLMGGQPGAGKSTLLLQTACYLAPQQSVLYITGEESLQQIALRAERLGLSKQHLNLLAETDVQRICQIAKQEKPSVIIVDSIQVMYLQELASAPGGVAQVKECAAILTRFAKQTQTILLLVGHVTKEGSLAGPKVLEHIIDCSILLEGDSDSRFRTLRGQKNRFGAVNELGVFAMMETGLKEVKNPSAIFLSRSEKPAAGTLVTVIWEGTRPLLVELQALVDQSVGHPRRVAVGLDSNRLAMLLSVLHRHGGIQVGDQDIFVNVVGGVKVTETSADLALILTLVSSFRDQILPQDLIVIGEVGLTGEIRPVVNGQDRISEAAKHGFKKVIVPKANAPKKPPEGMEVIAVEKLSDALEWVFR